MHTFAGFFGNAIAPMTMLAIAAWIGVGYALVAAGGLALVAACRSGWRAASKAGRRVRATPRAAERGGLTRS